MPRKWHVRFCRRVVPARERLSSTHEPTLIPGRLPAYVLRRLTEWAGDDVPSRILVFAGDLPLRDDPLPRSPDDAAAAKLLQKAATTPTRSSVSRGVPRSDRSA
jgi:hypothetical protein